MLFHSLRDTLRHRVAHAGKLVGWTEEKRRQRLRRDAFSTLLHVDDDVLHDVAGICRAELEAAVRAPLEVDAAAVIHQRRLQDSHARQRIRTAPS